MEETMAGFAPHDFLHAIARPMHTAKLGLPDFTELFDPRRDIDGTVVLATESESQRSFDGVVDIKVDAKGGSWKTSLVCYPGHRPEPARIDPDRPAPPTIDELMWILNPAAGIELGDSALHVAARNHNGSAVSFLCSSGAMCARKNAAGLTAYECTEQNGDEEAAARTKACFPKAFQATTEQIKAAKCSPQR